MGHRRDEHAGLSSLVRSGPGLRDPQDAAVLPLLLPHGAVAEAGRFAHAAGPGRRLRQARPAARCQKVLLEGPLRRRHRVHRSPPIGQVRHFLSLSTYRFSFWRFFFIAHPLDSLIRLFFCSASSWSKWFFFQGSGGFCWICRSLCRASFALISYDLISLMNCLKWYAQDLRPAEGDGPRGGGLLRLHPRLGTARTQRGRGPRPGLPVPGQLLPAERAAVPGDGARVRPKVHRIPSRKTPKKSQLFFFMCFVQMAVSAVAQFRRLAVEISRL